MLSNTFIIMHKSLIQNRLIEKYIVSLPESHSKIFRNLCF